MKFSELDLHPLLAKNLERIQFAECTPVQEMAIPHVLAGRDIAGLAQTGTGKTGAFLVPLINRILLGRDKIAERPESKSEPAAGESSIAESASDAVSTEVAPEEISGSSTAPLTGLIEEVEGDAVEIQSPRYFTDWRRRNYILILVPTRELAEQVFDNAKKLIEGTGLKAVAVYGGTTYEKQKAGFKDGVEFVIATPGRLIDLHKENFADLRQVRAIVFDEADRMFDMGFKDDMKYILRRIPRDRQFLVFSATLNFDVLNTAYEFGAFPVEVNISKDQPKAENVADEILHIGSDEKARFLLSLLKKHAPRQTIVFSNFKRNVERITKFLNSNGQPAVGISSLLTQAQRNRVMAQFKAQNDRNILVATDVAARGLDILGVDMVINFELPDDAENYVHRIGRTGRAGLKGRAISMVSDRDVEALERIENYLGHKVSVIWLEEQELVKEAEMKPFPNDYPRAKPSAHGGRGDRFRQPREGRGERPHQGGRGGGGQQGQPRRGGPHRRDERQGRPQDENRNEQRRHQPAKSQSQEQKRRQPHSPNARPNQNQNGGQRHSQQNRSHAHQGQKSQRHRRPQQSRQNMTRPNAQTAKPSGLGQKVSGFFKRLFGSK